MKRLAITISSVLAALALSLGAFAHASGGGADTAPVIRADKWCC